MKKSTFKSMVGVKLTEASDFFDGVDVLKFDPDRVDAYDIVQTLMPTLVRIAYVNLMHDQEKHRRAYPDQEEDDPVFEFTADELEERLEDLVGHIVSRLEDTTSHDRHAYIDRVKDEFKQKLEEK